MPLITAENAAEMGRKSALARQAAKQLALQRAREEEARIQEAFSRPVPPDAYIGHRLSCVREQLSRIDRMLLEEHDPQRLDRLAAASAKLSEIERQLAGRPGPGQFRPTTPRRRIESTTLIPE